MFAAFCMLLDFNEANIPYILRNRNQIPDEKKKTGSKWILQKHTQTHTFTHTGARDVKRQDKNSWLNKQNKTKYNRQ